MTNEPASGDLELTGLDGGNPLGFLAAIGALRVVARTTPDHEVKLSWNCEGGCRPSLHFATPLDRGSFLEQLHRGLDRMSEHPAFLLGDDLEVAPEVFREFSQRAADCAAEDRT